MRTRGLAQGWAPYVACERLEVPDDGGKVELVASASETSQAHSLEAMMNLQVREAWVYPSRKH
jgi:hypothetical protein